MRILHTSDWHLGRNFHGVHLLDAQARALEILIQVVRSERIDAVVVAGDIYDRAIPAADAVSVLSHALSEFRGAGAHVVAISGNHDSAVRLGFAEPLLAASGVTLRGDVGSAGKPVIIPDRDNQSAVAFYPIPYLEPELARHAMRTPDQRSHDALLRVAVDRCLADSAQRPDMRKVVVAHAFVTGGQECESELALSVGGSAEVPMSAFSGFDYVALGHLHGRQKLGDGRCRYSGSLLPYSFSERDHVKGAWLVDLDNSGAIKVTALDLPVQRSLHVLRGELDQLLSAQEHRAAEDGYVHAMLTDGILPRQAMARLRHRFPHTVLLSHRPVLAPLITGRYAERMKGRSDIEIMHDFVDYMAGRPPTDEETNDLRATIQRPAERQIPQTHSWDSHADLITDLDLELAAVAAVA